MLSWWIFGDIINYFKFLDFKENLKIGLSQVGKIYIVCAILRNALTCMYENSAAEFFDLDPPTLQEYFVWAEVFTKKNGICFREYSTNKFAYVYSNFNRYQEM